MFKTENKHMPRQYEPLETEKSLIDASLYDSYNDFAAAKIEELSDMIVVLCVQYDETSQVLQLAQFQWLNEYYKHHKEKVLIS